jgi:sigma-B regulation protein RsbQ
MDILKRNNVHIEGDAGDVILYAHGFGCNKNMWDRITPAFVNTHRQIVFDYVGSGKSDPSAFSVQKYSNLKGYAQDILEICDTLNLEEDITFVGHSVSATIGLLASIERPKLFKRLILIGPSPCFLNDPPHYFGGFERKDLEGLIVLMDQNYIGWAQYLAPIVAGEEISTVVAHELSDSFCSTDPIFARVFAQATFFSDNRADLPKVTTPCLILQHARDALAPLVVGEYLHKHLRGSILKVLDVDGHCAHMSHPDLVIEAMKKYFLN